MALGFAVLIAAGASCTGHVSIENGAIADAESLAQAKDRKSVV